MTGLRHDTEPRTILGAAHGGAAFTVLCALERLLAACGLDPAEPSERPGRPYPPPRTAQGAPPGRSRAVGGWRP
ncbi:hypothetical protein ACFW2Y_32145 [Streptomyces sp. NPDC058877]|uniref:hypothetical protein n=1 Tax=Streptomyces sp. NPDC058877 TaxID=3346665 RepID=UPI003683E0BC